jgi:predicted protein tyrosine phosphatase
MIIVCSLNDLNIVCNSLKPENLISVIDPGYEPDTPSSVKNHLKLGFDDILEARRDNHIFRNNVDEIPQIPPNQDHVKSIVNFTDDWSSKDVTVIHCWCGVSRSMATLTYLLCRGDSTNIDRNIRYIRSIAPHANPNKLLIELFEKTLNLKSEISEAYSKYPYTQTYDCSINFAPVTIFNFDDIMLYQ